MAGVSEFLAFATGVGANVESQADYNADPARVNGFSAGIALSAKLNKPWRQASFMAAVTGQIVADIINEAVNDDGDLAGKISQLWRALMVAPYFPDAGSANSIVITVPSGTGLTFPAPTPGMTIKVLLSATNTSTAVNLNWMGNGNKPIVYPDGSLPQPGDLQAQGEYEFTYDGTSWQLGTFTPSSIRNNNSLRVLQVYSTPGSFTYTPPAGVHWVYGICIGGGGAGASVAGTYTGGGGGAGGYAEGWMAVTPGVGVSITVGAGAGNPGVGADGGNGGSSSIGAYMSCTGGVGGHSNANSAGGDPGAPTLTANTFGWRGGYGNDGSTVAGNYTAGSGGSSFAGGGIRASTATVAGTAAFGAGGGGTYGGGAAQGGAGMPGIVIIKV